MKTWMKVTGGVVTLLIAAMVAVVAVLVSYDYNKLKPELTNLVKEATGRDLVINGDLNLAVSFSPTLNVSDVTFTNAAWASAEDMLRLKTLSAKVELLPLVRGHINIDYIVLDGLTLMLETDGKGHANWEFNVPGDGGPHPSPSAAAGGLAFTPVVRDVRLRDVDVTYIDGATGGRIHALLASLDINADGFDQPMEMLAVAAYQGVKFEIGAELGSLEKLVGTGGGAFPVNFALSAPGLNASIIGSVDQPSAGMAVNARIDAKLTDMDTLAKLSGVDLPKVKGVSAKLNVQGSGTAYEFSAIDVKLGGSDLQGRVNIDLGGKRPVLNGKLSSSLLDVNTLANIDAKVDVSGGGDGTPFIATVKPEKPGAAKKIFSNETLDLSALSALDADLSYGAQRMLAGPVDATGVTARVKLAGGNLSLTGLGMAIDDGRVDGALSLNSANAIADMTAALKLHDLQVASLLENMGLGKIAQLSVNGNIDVSSVGESVHRMVANMTGKVSVGGRDGSINDKLFSTLTDGVGDLLPWVKQASGNVISCFVADMPIRAGVVTAKTVAMDTPGFTVRLTGNVDLGGELFHLTVVPNAKTTSLASFAVPMRLKGPLSAPYVGVDPGEVVLGTVGNIAKAPVTLLTDLFQVKQNAKNDPCVDALSGGKTPTSSDGKTQAAPPPQEKGAAKDVEAIKKLGGALQDLFGK